MAFKAVLILGPDLKLSTSELATINTFYTKSGYLIIGDGSKGITNNDLASLKGKIDSKTRVDIFAHGNDFSGHHKIGLETSGSTDTKTFFTQLTELNNYKPLYLHLWSCYGGLANKNIKSLPKQSVLVTHAPTHFTLGSNLVIYSLIQAITTLQKHTSHLSSWQNFSDNLSFESIQTEAIITWDKDKEYKFEVRPKLLDVLSNPTQSLQTIATDYQEYYNQLPFKKLPQLKSFIAEQQQVTNFKHGYFIFSCGYDKQEDLIYTLESNRVDKLLFQASVNSETCLHQAALYNKLKLVSFLLEQQVDPNQTNRHDATPLLIAAEKGHKDIVELLLKAGADPNQANSDGAASLFMATQNGHREIVELLLRYGANSNQANSYGATPLFMAAQNGHKDIAELLLKAGANPNHTMNNGTTPLSKAAENDHKDIAELLLKYGADPNQTMNNGITPLLATAFTGHTDVAELLLKCGADPTRELQGLNAIKIAKIKKFDDLTRLLEDFANGKIKYSQSDCPSYNHDATTQVAMVGDSNTYNHDEL